MEFVDVVNGRVSVRRFQSKPVLRETIKEIVKLAGRAPSWKNTQCVRYIVVDDAKIIEKLANEEVAGGFAFNVKTLQSAAAIVIQTYVEGLSGFNEDGTFSTAKKDKWQMYDAGISASIFALAAYEKGIGTVIQGYFDENAIKKYIDIPQNQVISAIICMGYPEGEIKPTVRKDVNEVVVFYENKQ